MNLEDKRDQFLNEIQCNDETEIEAKHPDNEIIRNLAALKPIDYDRVRVEQAKELGIRPAVLDAEEK